MFCSCILFPHLQRAGYRHGGGDGAATAIEGVKPGFPSSLERLDLSGNALTMSGEGVALHGVEYGAEEEGPRHKLTVPRFRSLACFVAPLTVGTR